MSGANVGGQSGTYGTLGTAGSSNVPGARAFAVSWTDGSGNLWLFGGYGFGSAARDTNVLNDLWKYSVGEWTWMGGSNVVSQPGIYGTRGTPAPNNVPGARQNAVSWIDTSGNLWLFGGFGVDSTGTVSVQNDLWKYSAGEWTWMSGSDVASEPGTYGTQGIAASNDVPGARYYSVGWTDTSGNFWLFGGIGLDSNGSDGNLNDLWKYSAGEWTWMSGSNVVDQVGTYGTQGTAASNNVPGAREQAFAWNDASGNFWLFGGVGYDSAGNLNALNDLWK
jgi:N-acetylneuraminic acid mutarotase